MSQVSRGQLSLAIPSWLGRWVPAKGSKGGYGSCVGGR